MRLVFLAPAATKKRYSLILLALTLIAFSCWRRRPGPVTSRATLPGLPLSGKIVVVDPGHGGYDPGVFRNNTREKDINLAVALALRNYLQGGGARVVMTRETDRDLLLLPAAGPKKKLDMKHRLQVIHTAKPDLVISIHANAISSPHWSGAQTFYKNGCEKSKKLAELIQLELVRVLQNTTRAARPGDFFILNEAGVPAALVETGFISNPREAGLLAEQKYQSRLAWAVYLGIIRYSHMPSGVP